MMLPTADNYARGKLYECLHEAGRVVAARAHGFPVAWVSIDQEFISTHGGDMKGETQVLGPVSMAICSPVINPIVNRGKMSEPDDERNVRGYCVQVLSGPLVEEHFNPDFDPNVAGIDLAQVAAVVKRTTEGRSQRRAFHKKAMAEAVAFVEANKGTMFHFAVALYNRRTILENDIDPMIATARAQAMLGAVTT